MHSLAVGSTGEKPLPPILDNSGKVDEGERVLDQTWQEMGERVFWRKIATPIMWSLGQPQNTLCVLESVGWALGYCYSPLWEEM